MDTSRRTEGKRIVRVSNRNIPCSICGGEIHKDEEFVYHLVGIRLTPAHRLCKDPCDHIFIENLSSPGEPYCSKCGQVE